MKHFKSIVVLFSILVLLVGSIGVGLVSHFCEGNETTVLTFAEDEHCGEADEMHTDDCCSDQLHTESCCEDFDEDDDCCSNELHHIQLKLDFFDEVNISAVIITDFSAESFLVYNEFPCNLANEEVRKNPPPPESGKDLILKKQNWLI